MEALGFLPSLSKSLLKTMWFTKFVTSFKKKNFSFVVIFLVR